MTDQAITTTVRSGGPERLEADAALASMDAAVFVVTADPPISASELTLLRRVQELSVRTYIVLNKADRMDHEERREVVEFTRHAVDEAGGSGAETVRRVGSAAADDAVWELLAHRQAVLEELTAQIDECVRGVHA